MYIYKEREREFIVRNWLVQLGRLRSPLICYLLAGDSRKPVV